MEKIKNNIKEILKYGSPIYVYDFDIINDRCINMYKFKEKLENKLKIDVNMHYSTKANNNPNILRIVKDNNLSVDAMSLYELHINKKIGFKSSKILYVCNNIDEEEMKEVYKNNVLICLDSISQVEMWGKLFPNTNIMIRINPGVLGVGHSKKVITSGKDTKFGIIRDDFDSLFETVKKYNLKIVGVHEHLGSLFLDDKIDDYINGVRTFLEIVDEYFKDISIIDLGGGFGVPYKELESDLDLEKLSDKLIDVLLPFVNKHQSIKEFKFEPGRYIPCEGGYLIGRVNSIKKLDDIYWIGTDIGMNQLVRPSMYDAYHNIEVLNESSDKIIANICGNICESGDILGKKRLINKPKVGDNIIVYNAGAYGYSMASNYTGRLRPAEVMIRDGKVFLIRKRETIEDLDKNIIFERIYKL